MSLSNSGLKARSAKARSATPGRSQRSAKSPNFRSLGHSPHSKSGKSSKNNGGSINITKLMPFESKLAINVILIAASLEKHASIKPEDDIYHKLKANKTFHAFYKSVNHSFDGVNEKVFSYLFFSIILCTSSGMDFSFEEYGLTEEQKEFKLFANEFSSYVLEELAGISKQKESVNESTLRQPTRRTMTGPKRRQTGGVNTRTNRYMSKKNRFTKNNSKKYNQTGGWWDMILAIFLNVYARMGQNLSRNRRFRNLSFGVMFLYFIFSTFSLYNNVRHLLWPDALYYENGDMAPDYSRLMDTTSTALTAGIPQQVHQTLESELLPLGEMLRGLPSAISAFLENANLGMDVGAVIGVVVGFGFQAAGINAGAGRIRLALQNFMTTPYYTRMVQHITDVAQNMGNGISAVVARTNTRAVSESTGMFGFVRRMLGIDVARLDDQLGDMLYNTANSDRISSDVINTILQNTGIAITRISEDFVRMIGTEVTRFRTRIDRHAFGIRYAIGGIILSGTWLYMYMRYVAEVRRRRKELGSVGQIYKKFSKDHRDPDDSGDGPKRLENGGDGDGSGSGSPLQISM